MFMLRFLTRSCEFGKRVGSSNNITLGLIRISKATTSIADIGNLVPRPARSFRTLDFNLGYLSARCHRRAASRPILSSYGNSIEHLTRIENNHSVVPNPPPFATMSLKRKAAEVADLAAKKPKVNASITSFFGAPKSTINPSKPASTTSPPPVPDALLKFDKSKWIEGLNEEQKELLTLEIETLHESWLAHLKDEVTSKEFLELKRFLKREIETGKKIFPPMEDVYSWYG